MHCAKYKWQFSKEQDGKVDLLCQQFGIGKLAARVLSARGWENVNLSSFLNPTGDKLPSPYLMKGMDLAVTRIRRAIEEKERIWIYGDYDADGVTSSVILYKLLLQLGANFVHVYIPHREQDGYGMHSAAIDLAVKEKITLIITVDNGIHAKEPIAYAAAQGIDCVVTDHHEVPSELPSSAVAIVNPKQEGCTYPFRELCGAGIAFQVAHALLGEVPIALADLAAIGTVADLMPIIEDNRILVTLGLTRLNKDPSPGIRALAKASNLEIGELTSTHIAFFLAPRLNAAGRLKDASLAFKLLIATEEKDALFYANQLNKLNIARKSLVIETMNEAEQHWREQHPLNDRKFIVVAKQGWMPGVVGLVAARLVEKYKVPACVLSIEAENQLATGSARTMNEFNLYEAFTKCQPLLVKFGGHQAAAGLTISTANIPLLAQQLNEIADYQIPKDQLPLMQADLVVRLQELSLSELEQLSDLEPFGKGNPYPRFIVLNARIQDCATLGKQNQHLRLLIEQNGCLMEAIAFNQGEEFLRFENEQQVDLLGEITVNRWQGRRKIQMKLLDFRLEKSASPIINRDHFIMIYKLCHQQQHWQKKDPFLTNMATNCVLTSSQIRWIIEVFIELGFIGIYDSVYQVMPHPPRKQLKDSLLYCKAKEAELVAK